MSIVKFNKSVAKIKPFPFLDVLLISILKTVKMKKVIAAVVMMMSITSFAQEANSKETLSKGGTEQLTAEQRAQLQAKELTLNLDLNTSQQKEMAKLLAEKGAKREALRAAMKEKKASGVKPTANERFEWRNAMLDEQIATKEKVKKILNKEQFEKWEKMNHHKKLATRKKMMYNKRDMKQG